MTLSAEAARLLAALRRGETVGRLPAGGWKTSGGMHALGSTIHVLVEAGAAEYCEWTGRRWRQSVGTKARLAPQPAKQKAA